MERALVKLQKVRLPRDRLLGRSLVRNLNPLSEIKLHQRGNCRSEQQRNEILKRRLNLLQKLTTECIAASAKLFLLSIAACARVFSKKIVGVDWFAGLLV